MEKEMIKFIHKTLPLPNIEERKNVVCVLPHPDDGEIGGGGTVAKLKSKGATVRYVLVTDGGAGIRGKSREETKKIRKKEQETAAGILGVDEIRWLDYPDGGEYELKNVREDLKKIFNDIKPDLIITVDPFLPYESHPDHKICGLATIQTLLFDYHNPSVPIAFFFTAYPNQFICVEKQWDKKFESIFSHKSQIGPEIAEIFKKYFETKGNIYGRKIGCKHAEGFKVLLPLMLHAFEETLWI